MITHKHITKAVAVLMVFAVCLCLCATAFKEKIKTYADSNTISMEYETALFDTETPMNVNIIMDSEEWDDMLSNASSEEYKECNVEINGTTFYRVGIRPKGNTSLSSIASDPTTDRYSFKLEFDHYVDGQTCFGLDKLILNNNYADATSMKEALIYDLFKYVGADASLYNYAKINVNGEYWGVYTALEAVEDSFLLRNYGVKSGELYKPESMGVGGGGEKDEKQGGQKPESMTLPESANQAETDSEKSEASASVLSVAKTLTETESTTEVAVSSENDSSENGFDKGNMPDMPDERQKGGGGFSMSSGGADLNYIDDELDSYSTIWDGEITDSKKADHKRVVTALKNISEGTDLENYMDIDNLVKYMAVHVFSVNDDSLSGSMAHNYYLYESDGKLNLIPWDYNLAFGGMGGGNNATSVVNEAIDNAFSATNFFDTLTENEEYNALYYENLKKVSEYISGGEFEKFYNRVRSQIDELVETDPTAFYSYDEYTEAAETLYEIVKLRGESIEKQLSGTIPSTSELQKNSDSLVDASSINLSVMGSMNGGDKGGFDVKNVNTSPSSDSSQSNGESTSSSESDNSTQAKAAQGEMAQNKNGTPPEMPNGENGSQPQMPNGEAPNGMTPPNANGEEATTSSGETESTSETESADKPEQQKTETADFSDTSSSESTSSSSQTQESVPNGGNQKPDGNSPGGGQMNQPGAWQEDSSSQNGKNFIVYGACLGIMLLFLLFAALYKRRPGKG